MAIYILLVNIIVFTFYVVYVLAHFGIPVNLSITYYTFERRKKGTGLLFPGLMAFICSTAVPLWIAVTSHASTWGAQFVCLPVTALVCLLAVACSARYKMRPKLIYFHYGMAIIAAACALSWTMLVAYRVCYILLGILCLMVMAGILTKTLKKCTLFWLEVAAFYGILITLLVIYLIPVSI